MLFYFFVFSILIGIIYIGYKDKYYDGHHISSFDVFTVSIFFGFIISGLFWITAGTYIGTCIPQIETKTEIPITSLTITTNDDDILYLYGIDKENEEIYQTITPTDTHPISVKKGDYNPVMITYETKFEKEWYHIFANDIALEKSTEFYITEEMLYK